MNLAATSLPLTTDISTSVYSRSSSQTDLLQPDKAGLHSATSLLFIDSAVKDYQSLMAGVRPETEAHILDSNQDAIRQITQVLLGREGISSLHIVSHGESGGLDFGSKQLNLADLPEYAQSLRSWGKSLTDDADILLYGCDIAQGAIGQSFVQQFAQLTGADIAASNDLTGSAALGGNWTLEVNTGEIAASLVFQASAIANYQHILPVDLISTADPNVPDSTVNGYQSKGNVSENGRYIIFDSTASNLVATDTNNTQDVFVLDLQTGNTSLVSANSSGTNSGNGYSSSAEISGNSRYVVFTSNATDLVANDTNGSADLFVRDLQIGTTALVNVNSTGTSSIAIGSDIVRISNDGRYIIFTSGAGDVFERDMVAGTTTLVNVSSAGDRGNGFSSIPSMTSDGRYITFVSTASNLVANDTNGTQDVFIRDMVTGTTTLVSANSTGTGSGNGSSGKLNVRISSNGRYVVFASTASDLVTNDTNGTLQDVFVRDLQTNTTTLVSVNSRGTGSGNAASFSPPSISSDGRYVAFVSTASDLVANDTNQIPDVFIRDLVMGTTTLVSVNSTGTGGGNGISGSSGTDYNFVRLSSDGRYVAFLSTASNLVANDTNNTQDVFVRDLLAGTTTLVSRASTGGSGNDFSYYVGPFSSNGRFVFHSYASNLVPNDNNGLLDAFIYDVVANTITLVAKKDPAAPASNSGNSSSSTTPNSVSVDGRYVVFTSTASNLAPNDTNGSQDVFLRDRTTGITTLISRTSTGTSGNAFSTSPIISNDGRYVVYSSNASDLVTGDNNNTGDVFLYDRVMRTTALVSRTSTGASGNNISSNAVISSDGRFIAFESNASNLVVNDSNGTNDIFVWDQQTNNVTLVSHSSTGSTGNGYSSRPAISNDGHYVAFSSAASNLVTGDSNSGGDVFIWDRQTGNLTLVSHTSTGSSGINQSYSPVISGDGNYVAFVSDADNLATSDSNYTRDVFLWERQTGNVTLVSRTATGSSSNSFSDTPVISNDGRYVAFVSKASNLTAGDNNYASDVYVYDRQTNAVKFVSHISTGSSGDSDSDTPVMSADGRFIAFTSRASNLVANDTNRSTDAFVWDRQTDQVSLVSRTNTGTSGNSYSYNLVFSSDGTYLVFSSDASNLVTGDLNVHTDVFGIELSSAPTIALPGNALTYIENNPAMVLDTSATVVDVDSPNFNTGNLTVSFAANGTAADRLAILNQGAGAGQVGVSGSNVTYGGTTIGSLTGGTGTTPLVITFNTNANTAAVQTILRNITFANVSDGPSIAPRTVSVLLTGNTGIVSNIATKTINVTAVNDAPTFTTGTNQQVTAGAGTQTVTNWVSQFSTGPSDETSQAILGYQIISNSNPSLFAVLPTINAAGTLTYTPTNSLTRSATATIGVIAQDNGGVANGGVDRSTVNFFTVTVTPPPGISISSSSQNEGRNGITSYTFTISLSEASSRSVAVSYATTDGTATVVDNDYTAASGTLTFKPGETSQTITVAVKGDTKVELDETFLVKLFNSTNATISPNVGVGTGTIVNDDYAQLLWRNSASGENAVWQLNGFTIQTSYYLPSVADANWQIVSRADFNNDGTVDLLWRNKASGENAIWQLNSTGLQTGYFITPVADLNWQIVGTADFNNDGIADIVWRNQATGQNAIWQLNSTGLQTGYFITSLASSSWQIASIADFNHDGTADILWRNQATGQNAIWQMKNDFTVQSGRYITPVADPNWEIAGTADFNRDGIADIVWRNKATGQNAIWQMNSTDVQTGYYITPVADLNWQIAGIADFNGDGSPDLLWRNPKTGKVGIWQMNGFTDSQGYLLPDESSDWLVKSL